MVRIDAHQHFWTYAPERHGWISEEMSVIRRDFMPGQLLPLLQAQGITGTIAVQTDQTEQETAGLLSLAAAYPFIQGVVGWTDLEAPDLEEKLQAYRQYEQLKGFRHILEAEPRADFCLRPAFLKGLTLLGRYGYTYDILVRAGQLCKLPALLEACPGQRFVLDHMAKPQVRSGDIARWRDDIRAVAGAGDISCKVSGLVTEARFGKWRKEDFFPYLDVAVEAFGTDRLMYGSDWPVCLVSGSYAAVYGLVQDYFSGFSAAAQERFFGINAAVFYGLQDND